MPPFRNPFTRRPDAGLASTEENKESPNVPTFERVDTVGSKTSALSIRSGNSEPAEYKLSVVNDSGVYLPPSPPEKKGLWPRRSNVSMKSARNSEDIEAFSISRESFDSYRRSFDISARSPINQNDPPRGSLDYRTRASLDSAQLPRIPRSAMGDRRFERQPPTAEEGFEDVGLNDEKPAPKKKGFFSRFGEDGSEQSNTSTGRFHIMGGRKRGQSGVGEELGSMKRDDGVEGVEVK